MNEIRSIQTQLENMVKRISHNISSVYYALEELNRLTNLMFELTPYNAEQIQQWITDNGFSADEKGFFRNQEILEKHLRKEELPNSLITYHWPAKLKDDDELAYRFYVQRNIGKILEQIYSRLGNISIIYYQDIPCNASLAYPYFDISTAIPSDFDWYTYFACQSVIPENNPERKIRWSVPNIDYAGEGLISIASIPFYQKEEFLGVWSIDVPFKSIHNECVFETCTTSQVNFITDLEGNIIIHPAFETLVDKDKGSFIQMKIEELGGGYKELDVKNLAKKQKGTFEITDSQGESLIVVYQIIANIDWILFGSFSKSTMVNALYKKISNSFHQMTSKNLQSQINIRADDDLQLIIDSYNEMVEVVNHHQKEKELAFQQLLDSEIRLKQELEKKVEERTKELQISIETKNRFFSIISHDLRSPLNAILGLSSLILEGKDDYDKEHIIGFIEHINKSGKSTFNLLENLLEWSNIQTGHMKLKPEEIILNTIVSNTVQQLLNTAIVKDIILHYNIKDSIRVYADKNMLNTVFRNLINNSIKFTEAKGRVTISAEERKDEVLVSIEDTGVGMSKEKLDKLFKIDERLESEGTSNEKGSSLGLILCKEFISANGGKIWVESEVGKGSKFSFTIPNKKKL